MPTYFDITTKSKYLYASDIALQCMYIQFNPTGSIVGTDSSTASSFLIRIIPTTIINCHCHWQR